MRQTFTFALLTLSFAVAGCNRPGADTPDTQAKESSLVWLEKDIEQDGLKIALGYRNNEQEPAGSIEPVVQITRDRQPVADAMAFVSLASPDGNQTLADEVATVFLSASDGDPAIYRGELRLPDGTTECALRFRIVLPGVEEEWTHDTPLHGPSAR